MRTVYTVHLQPYRNGLPRLRLGANAHITFCNHHHRIDTRHGFSPAPIAKPQQLPCCRNAIFVHQGPDEFAVHQGFEHVEDAPVDRIIALSPIYNIRVSSAQAQNSPEYTIRNADIYRRKSHCQAVGRACGLASDTELTVTGFSVFV